MTHRTIGRCASPGLQETVEEVIGHQEEVWSG
jgi:hypothetical protein